MPTAKTTPELPATPGWTRADRFVLGAVLCLALARSLALVLSPLELGVDEAQYWLWGTDFDFGYFTKPPLTSWIVALSHTVFGHHAWAVRLPAPWIHFGCALLLWRCALWLGGPAAGRLAAILWSTLPAVGIAGFVISTDTPLLLFWSAGLLGLVGVMTSRVNPGPGMALAGGAFGMALLSKYAAMYGLIGVSLFWLAGIFGQHRHDDPDRDITAGRILVFAIAMFAVASPNIAWNLANELTTVRHLGDNANLDKHSYSFHAALEFLLAQLAVAGPLAFVLMAGVLRPGRNNAAGWLLLCMSVPVIVIITVQAFLSEANANWAVAAMPALVVWLACWLSRGRRLLSWLTLSFNFALTATVLLVAVAGSLGQATPASDPLRRLRGWQGLADDTQAALVRHDAYTVIADRRATASLLGWHFHDLMLGGDQVEVLVIDADGVPSNHFEQNLAWRRTPGRRIVLLGPGPQPPELDGVEWLDAAPPAISRTRISARRERRLYMHLGVERP